jgi:hypothetical protein
MALEAKDAVHVFVYYTFKSDIGTGDGHLDMLIRKAPTQDDRDARLRDIQDAVKHAARKSLKVQVARLANTRLEDISVTITIGNIVKLQDVFN